MKIILIGAGGHAKVVYDALRSGDFAAAAVEVRASEINPQRPLFMGIQVHAPELPKSTRGTLVHVAIGNGETRSRFLAAALNLGGDALTVRHPSAHIAADVELGRGSFIAAGAIVSAAARLGDGVIINHNAVVDHDCDVGSWSHIAPGAILGGGVSVGQHTLIGAGSVVLPGLSVGDNVIIGAGSVVTKPVAPGSLWIGTTVVHQDGKK